MKFGLSFILVLACFLVAGQHETGSLFIIGGGKRPVEMVQFMMDKAQITENDPITILPWASEEPDSSSFYAKKQFSELGHQHFLDLQPNALASLSKSDIKKFLKSKLIYIPGGVQGRFMEIAVKFNFDSLIKVAFNRGAMIAGTSAGAAIMSDKMITGTALKYDEYHPTFRTLEKDNIEVEQGLGLLHEDIIVDQHFIWRSRYNRLLTAIIEFPNLTGWGIEESTAAYVKNGMVEVVGKYQLIVFKNTNKEQAVKNGLLGAKDLSIDILLPGDSFSIH
ncbi:MAG: cyanophycinase [Cyclobacteriaceae bacterium]